MTRTEEREAIISLLYLQSMNGNAQKENFEETIFEKVADVNQHLTEIDHIIVKHLENWTIERLNLVDKAIIRYAVYEMMFTDTPYEIIINEALELTKKYSNLDDDQAKKFNNKLLDTIKNKLFS